MPDDAPIRTTEAVDILSQVFDDLLAQDVPDDVADLVLAACQGDRAFADALGGSPPARPERAHVEADATGIYLKSITAEGFRGIGPSATLHTRPQPGLTLVIGRNGSGKSSFAEAAEIAMTGRSSRWDERSKVWRTGWQSLHHPTSRIRVETVEEDSSRAASITCAWSDSAKLEEAQTAVRRDGRDGTLDDLGWAPALSMFRPFLSYAELGDAVTGRPTDLFDALHSILGLGVIERAQQRLKEAKRPLDKRVLEARDLRRAASAALAEVDDDRARSAREALRPGPPDLDLLEDLATGSVVPVDGRITMWRRVAEVGFPPVGTTLDAAHELTAATTAVEATHGEFGARSLRLADILERAVDHIQHEGEDLCPVCGQTTLDARWQQDARSRAQDLRASASELERAHARAGRARQALTALIASAARPEALSSFDDEVAEALTRWHAVDPRGEPTAVANAVLDLHSEVEPALIAARDRAQAELKSHEDRWQPLALKLGSWVSAARAVASEAPVLKRLRDAESWLNAEAADLRNARMQPYAIKSTQIWQMLRQESNVDLGNIRLEGRGNRRRVDLDVAIDGESGAALGVMSQGELHALGLALFLPRATSKESPFRFLVIDDPVQAMDPAKVEGLARVLEGVSRTRQVIVFTHDERLSEAVDRLGIDATTWEVVRRPNSAIELRKAGDAVSRYIKDARDLANADDIPAEMRGPVIAGFLRSAVEAAALERARRRMVEAGTDRAEMKSRISEAQTTNAIVALALFDDRTRGSAVLGRLDSWGRSLADGYRLCREGVHDDDFTGMSRDELRALAQSIEVLTDRLSRVSP